MKRGPESQLTKDDAEKKVATPTGASSKETQAQAATPSPFLSLIGGAKTPIPGQSPSITPDSISNSDSSSSSSSSISSSSSSSARILGGSIGSSSSILSNMSSSAGGNSLKSSFLSPKPISSGAGAVTVAGGSFHSSSNSYSNAPNSVLSGRQASSSSSTNSISSFASSIYNNSNSIKLGWGNKDTSLSSNVSNVSSVVGIESSFIKKPVEKLTGNLPITADNADDKNSKGILSGLDEKNEKSDGEGSDAEDGSSPIPDVEGGDDNDNISFVPIFSFSKPERIVSGEEQEDCLYQDRVKLYRWTLRQDAISSENHHVIEGVVAVNSAKSPSKYEWTEVGVGTIKVLREKQSNEESNSARPRCRLVMRRENSQGGVGTKLIFNAMLIPGVVTITRQNPASVVITCANIAETDYLESDKAPNEVEIMSLMNSSNSNGNMQGPGSNSTATSNSNNNAKKGPQLRLYAIRSKTTPESETLLDEITRCL